MIKDKNLLELERTNANFLHHNKEMGVYASYNAFKACLDANSKICIGIDFNNDSKMTDNGMLVKPIIYSDPDGNAFIPIFTTTNRIVEGMSVTFQPMRDFFELNLSQPEPIGLIINYRQHNSNNFLTRDAMGQLFSFERKCLTF